MAVLIASVRKTLAASSSGDWLVEISDGVVVCVSVVPSVPVVIALSSGMVLAGGSANDRLVLAPPARLSGNIEIGGPRDID
jgi:hypothetical protein